MTDLSPEIFNHHTAIVGRTGSGKSWAARGIVEDWLDAGERVCIVDPTDVWWGLRSDSAGTGPGFPVVVFGGEHADVPIGERSGNRIAEIVATRNMPAVIATAEMTGGERHRFMSDFLGTLYRLNRTPLHLVLDEADDVAPQNPLPENRRMLGDVDRIVRRGRVKGFRVMFITQRPAVLNKNVLTQASTLVAMRLPAPQDRKAIEDWIKGQADVGQAADVLSSLSSLPRGEGWVWAPDQGILRRHAFPMIRTFDSMRTPEHGEAIGAPSTLAPVELGDLRALMQVEYEAAGDAGHAGAAAAPAEIAAAEQRGYDRGLADGHRQEAAARGDEVRQMRAAMQAAGGYLAPYFDDVIDVRHAPSPPTIDAVPAATALAAPPARRQPRSAPSVAAVTNGALPSAAAKMLAVLARGMRLTWGQTATLAGLKARGGHFNAGRKALRDGGYIDESEAGIAATEHGIEAAGGARPKPTGTAELLAWWREALPQTSGRVLDQLCRASGDWVDRGRLADSLGLQPRGGHWNSAISMLRQNGLIEVQGNDMRATL